MGAQMAAPPSIGICWYVSAAAGDSGHQAAVMCKIVKAQPRLEHRPHDNAGLHKLLLLLVHMAWFTMYLRQHLGCKACVICYLQDTRLPCTESAQISDAVLKVHGRTIGSSSNLHTNANAASCCCMVHCSSASQT